MALLDQVINLGINTASQIAQHKLGATGSTVQEARAYLTDPARGVQTLAGGALAKIIDAYNEIKASGQNSQLVIANTVNAIETVRSAFESHVRSLGEPFWSQAGQGGVATINALAARLTADRRAELQALIGSAGGNASFAPDDTTLWIVAIAIVILFFLWRS